MTTIQKFRVAQREMIAAIEKQELRAFVTGLLEMARLADAALAGQSPLRLSNPYSTAGVSEIEANSLIPLFPCPKAKCHSASTWGRR